MPPPPNSPHQKPADARVSRGRGAESAGGRPAADTFPAHARVSGEEVLPHVLVLTDRHQAARPLPDVVAAAVDGGAGGVLLREKDLPHRDRAALADQLGEVLGDRPLLVGHVDGAPVEADGIHLADGQPVPDDPPGTWIGRSCHGAVTVEATAGCTHATLSPAYATASKPGYGPTVPLDAFADTPVPTYALGGIDRPERAAACIDAGAHGVAVMGAVMRAADPAAVVAGLVEAVEGVRA